MVISFLSRHVPNQLSGSTPDAKDDRHLKHLLEAVLSLKTNIKSFVLDKMVHRRNKYVKLVLSASPLSYTYIKIEAASWRVAPVDRNDRAQWR